MFNYDHQQKVASIDILQAYPKVCDGTLFQFKNAIKDMIHDMPPGFDGRMERALKGLTAF